MDYPFSDVGSNNRHNAPYISIAQQSSLDDDWVDGQAVCEYLCICDKTLQRLRSAGKITYSTIGNKYYYQIAEIKRCLRAHTIKSSEEMLQT